MSRLSDGDKKLLGNLSALGVIDSAPVRRSLDSASATSPVQLSRAELIAKLKGKGKRPSVASNNSLGRTSSVGSEAKAASLHRADSSSPTSPRKYNIFSREQNKAPSPIGLGSNGPFPAKPTSPELAQNIAKEKVETTLPAGFGERPRRAPLPPTRPERPTNESSLYSPRVSFPPPSYPIPALPHQNEDPPPTPPKSAERHKAAGRTALAQPPLISTDSSLSSTFSQLDIGNSGAKTDSDHPSQQYISGALPRSVAGEVDMSRAAPRSSHRKRKSPNLIVTASGHGYSNLSPGDRAALPISGVKGAKIDKLPTVERRAKANLSAHNRLEIQSFNDQTFLYNNKNPNINVQINTPTRITTLDKELPDTPSSISGTPTEMYRRSKGLRPATKPHKHMRSPLSPISTTHGKSNSAQDIADETSPSRLSAIPENSAASENSSMPSERSAQITTQMHLREGSVVTVSPPELTAWQRTVFIQGPIKLPKPVILPRKNSVASLEAFQDAIDHVYQDALYIPRRMSDELVLDDVVDFFQGFGLADVCFGNDEISRDLRMNPTMAAYGNSVHEVERFSTPPAEPEATPIEKVVAQEVVQSLSKPMPLSSLHIAPIESADTWHARAQIAQSSATGHTHTPLHQRADSHTLPRYGAASLPLKGSMLDIEMEPQVGSDTEMSGFDWDDDVEEMDGSSSWLAPRKYGFRGVDSRNPMRKMRRLVSTATAIL